MRITARITFEVDARDIEKGDDPPLEGYVFFGADSPEEAGEKTLRAFNGLCKDLQAWGYVMPTTAKIEALDGGNA